MKANRVNRFGPPDVIAFEDVARPVAGEGEVLVRVRAAGVGPWDAWIRAGKSVLPQRLPLTLGSDLSGVVEAVGPGDPGFRPGDEIIFGVTNEQFTGAYAEYAVAHAGELAVRVGTVMSLAEGRQAHEMLEGMRARPRGKIVLGVDP